jgi:hypothetical protein
MRIVLIAFFLIASQPLLLVTGILTKWSIECRDGACAGTVYATSTFGSPRDLSLTALAITAPHLLVVLVAAAMWLLTSRASVQSAQEHRAAVPELSGATQ